MTSAKEPARASYDVVIVGGGHNGLTAAAYLARAGVSTLLLERLPATGGAAISTPAFPGTQARLSRYSYLVSLMPEALLRDLQLDVQLRSRTTSSYTPYVRDGRAGGLLVERPEGEATRASFRELTGGDEEYAAWRSFYADVEKVAAAVAPTLLDPLPTESAVAAQVDPDLWRELVKEPLGGVVERRFRDDIVRGVVATDAVIGTFADLHESEPRPEPLLPLPPDRQRHRRVAGPRRRDGRGHRGTAVGRRRRRRRGAHRGRGQLDRRLRRRRRGDLARRGPHAHGERAPRALRRRAVGAADPARRGARARHQARGRPAQDQLPARPAARTEVRRRPRRRLRRHAAPGRGLRPARHGVRRGGLGPGAVRDAG